MIDSHQILKMARSDNSFRARILVLVAGFLSICGVVSAASSHIESTVPGFAYTRKALPLPSNATVSTHTTKPPKHGAKVKCTAEYWRVGDRKEEAWPRMVPVVASVAKVFGSQALEVYGAKLTLRDAMAMEESDGYRSLIKESSAALVNAYSREGFPFSAWKVKTLLIQSLVSENAAALQAKRFHIANQACS